MVIYLDSGDIALMAHYSLVVAGFTTNPSLLKAAGQTDYRGFAKTALRIANGRPLSLEVFADTPEEIDAQAREISSWGENVFVKVPVMTTNGNQLHQTVRKLSNDGIKVNVTAVMTLDQIRVFARCLSPQTDAILSIFAGRIADTGRHPAAFFTTAANVKHAKTKSLWASCREPFNIQEARAFNADIITIGPEIAKKQHLWNKDLHEYSLETCRQFHKDSEGMTL